MKRKTWILPVLVAVLACLSFTFTRCTVMIAKFDPEALNWASRLKQESLALIEKASGPYTDHKVDITVLSLRLDMAYRYAFAKPKNSISAKQWKILIDPERNLLGGFLRRWKEKGSLSQTFIDESKKDIADAFDHIIGLEKAKRR